MWINTIGSDSTTPEEQALGRFTRRKLKKLANWDDWKAGEHKQLNQFHKQGMFGKPFDPKILEPDAIILHPQWAYAVTRNGTRRSRLCCDGSKRAAPRLHAIASTWSSCVEMPIQRLFLAIAASEGYTVYGADVIDAYAHAAATGIKTCLTCDDAHREWACKALGKEVPKGHVMEVLHSSQGHPLSGEQWMQMIDDILVNKLGFTTTTHDRCIYKQITKSGETIFLLRQVDDILIATNNQAIAESITKRTGEHVKFKHEQELPITFMGIVEDYNGCDVSQFKDSILLSSKSYIERMLKTHGWERESPNAKPTCKDGETDGHLVSPLPADCLSKLFNEIGPEEGTIEHAILEKKQGFEYRVLLGELMYSMATSRPDIAYAATTMSKFSSNPSEYHYKLLKGVAKYLRITKSWGIKFTRPKDKQLSHLPNSNYQQPAPLPDAVGEFNIDIAQPRLIGFVDASYGSDLRKRRSITGFVFTHAGGAISYKSKTQTLTASSSTEAEFIAAYDAGKTARYLRFVLQELGFPQEGPTEIHIDNQAALQIINDNQCPTVRTRHLDIRWFSLQDWRIERSIAMKKIAGILNPSDDLSKPLAYCLHARHCRRMMGHYN